MSECRNDSTTRYAATTTSATKNHMSSISLPSGVAGTTMSSAIMATGVANAATQPMRASVGYSRSNRAARSNI